MTTKRKGTSLKELARTLGVSASTISRVLNGYENGFSVKPEVREKIMKAVEETGYRANPFIRSLRAKKTMMVAWLDYKQGDRGDSGVDEEALRSMVTSLSTEGYAVSCNFLSEEEPDQYFPQWPVDGVAIADVVDPEHLTRLSAEGIPYVVVNGVAGPGGCNVMVDEGQCSRLLLNYLKDQDRFCALFTILFFYPFW
jgi:LacI family transcriptional regulator